MKKQPKKTIFFGYESGHPENVDAIKNAVAAFNSAQKKYKARTWEDLSIGGKVVNSTIFDQIKRCDIFACDLTYLNHNVMFELGYAIGIGKKLLIFINSNVENAANRYRGFKLLENIGYVPFQNYKAIKDELFNKSHLHTIFLSQLVNISEIEKDTFDILYISSKLETQASLELTEYLNTSKFKIISDNTSEVEYQTLVWYINGLIKSRNILIHLLSTEMVESFFSNCESSFYAGLAYGLGKKVLLIAQLPFKAPIDYSDILLEYTDALDCLIKVEEWTKNNIKPIVEEVRIRPKKQLIQDDRKLNLLKLGIGCEIAEEEKDKLLSYFIEIDAYHKALERNISIFIGQKGSGKSALFIKLEDELSKDNLNFNVIIRPDSDELLEDVELSKLYNNERSKKAFFRTVWSYVIYSKLFLVIFSRLNPNKIPYYVPSKLEKEIIEFKNTNKDELVLNFFGALKKLNEIIAGQSLIDNPSILEDFHAKYLGKLNKYIHEYFKDKKYYHINVLGDNLDKTWDSRNDLSVQSEMLLSLFEFSNKMVRDLSFDERNDVKISIVLLLRKDIFDYILKFSREPDKLTVRTYEIDWSNNPNLLKNLIEERFRFSLNKEKNEDISSVWNEYFDFPEPIHPYEKVQKIIVLRPRDIIYFFTKLFESAVNKDHTKINNEDYNYAVDAYANFLQKNLIAEMKSEFPNIDQLFNKLFLEYYDKELDYNVFKNIVHSLGYNDINEYKRLLESLFKKKYIVCRVKNENVLINNVETLFQKLEEKKLFFLKKNKIVVIPNPQDYLLKDWKNI